MDMPQTRQSLLIELGRRSDAAWSEFLEIYEQAIYRLCRSRGLQDADARDVTQEVLVAVHRRIPGWDPDASRGSFRAWLLRVARNIAVDRVVERADPRLAAPAAAQTESERRLFEAPDASPWPSAEATGTAFELEYRRSLFAWASERVRSEVRPGTWRAFHATAVEGRGVEDVAAELGMSVGGVYTAKCRVVARIREKVSRLDPNSPERPQ